MRTTKKAAQGNEDEDDDENIDCLEEENEPSIVAKARSYILKARDFLHIFLETEGWAIFVSLIMQDGPFFTVRLISIISYGIVTYTNYFFMAKNALIITLQIYRIISIYLDHKAAKVKEQQQRRNLHSYKLQYVDYPDESESKPKKTGPGRRMRIHAIEFWSSNAKRLDLYVQV